MQENKGFNSYNLKEVFKMKEEEKKNGKTNPPTHMVGGCGK